MSEWASQSVSQPVSQSASHSVGHPANQPASQPISQPASQSASQPASQSATQSANPRYIVHTSHDTSDTGWYRHRHPYALQQFTFLLSYTPHFKSRLPPPFHSSFQLGPCFLQRSVPFLFSRPPPPLVIVSHCQLNCPFAIPLPYTVPTIITHSTFSPQFIHYRLLHYSF